jgi:hypothetical protein
MKCPKCGYNSFEYHDSCTKCSNDLTGFKNTFGLKAIVLPQEARTVMAESLMSDSSELVQETADVPNDMFSFDVPEDDTLSGGEVAPKEDPFSFDDDPLDVPGAGNDFSFDDEQLSPQSGADTNAFADLLESTPRKDDDPFSAPSAPPTAPAPAASSPGEFDVNSFSWDEPAAAGDAAAKPAADDFNSLFGDKDDAFK